MDLEHNDSIASLTVDDFMGKKLKPTKSIDDAKSIGNASVMGPPAAYDESLEAIHAMLSKRGGPAKSRTPRSNPTTGTIHEAPSPPKRSGSFASKSDDDASTTGSNHNGSNSSMLLRRMRGESPHRGSRVSDKRSTRSGKRTALQERAKSLTGSSRSLKDTGADTTPHSERRRRRIQRSHSTDKPKRKTTEPMDANDFNDSRNHRSASAIEKLLGYNKDDDKTPDAMIANGSSSNSASRFNFSLSSRNPLAIGLSKSRDSTTKGDDASVGGGKTKEKKKITRSKSHHTRSRSSTHKKRGTSVTRSKSQMKDRGTNSTSTHSTLSVSTIDKTSHTTTHERSSSTSGRTTPSTRRKPRRTASAMPSPTNSGDQGDFVRKKVRRHRSSSHTGNPLMRAHRSKERGEKKRGTKSLRGNRSVQAQQNEQELKAGQIISEDSFEKIWRQKKPSTPTARDDLDSTQSSRHTKSGSDSDNGKRSVGGGSSHHGSATKKSSLAKKTKLEKIHELQAKCDVLEVDLQALNEENRKTILELEENRREVLSLKKTVDDREAETQKLKTELASAQKNLDAARDEQRTERAELSDAAKDLARVNIEYAKSVDEARTVRAELDTLKARLGEKEEKTVVLENDLKTSAESIRQLEADVLFADDQIVKLEAEVALYREAVEKDKKNNSNPDDPNANNKISNLQEAKNEAEKVKLEEREKEIEERNRSLEDQRREFEAERKSHLEELQEKQQEFENVLAKVEGKRLKEEEQRAKDQEQLKISDENRHEMEEELNNLLTAFESENTALKGKLKSHTLDSTMKIQSRDEAISSMRIEMAKLEAEKKERDSAPDSAPTLLLEIENLKVETNKRSEDLEVMQMKKIELEDEVHDLQRVNQQLKKSLNHLEVEVAEQEREVQNQKRKTLEWQKKTGETSEKAYHWKEKAELWEKKAKDRIGTGDHPGGGGNGGLEAEEPVEAEPQALFLAAAVEKKAAFVSAANANGSWKLGRRIFGMSSESEDDESQAQTITRLEGINTLKDTEIKNLKSEMVKIQTNFKEIAYAKSQEYEILRREMEKIEIRNANLLEELSMARKLNKAISGSSAI